MAFVVVNLSTDLLVLCYVLFAQPRLSTMGRVRRGNSYFRRHFLAYCIFQHNYKDVGVTINLNEPVSAFYKLDRRDWLTIWSHAFKNCFAAVVVNGRHDNFASNLHAFRGKRCTVNSALRSICTFEFYQPANARQMNSVNLSVLILRAESDIWFYDSRRPRQCDLETSVNAHRPKPSWFSVRARRLHHLGTCADLL